MNSEKKRKGFYDSLEGIKDKYPEHFKDREPGWLVQKITLANKAPAIRVDPELPEEIKNDIIRLYNETFQ